MTKDYWEVHEQEYLDQQEYLAYLRDMDEQADATPPTEEDIEQMYLAYSAN